MLQIFRSCALLLLLTITAARVCRYTGAKRETMHRELGVDCTVVQMPNSAVKTLSPADFEFYPNIEKLALVNNDIHTIAPGTFANLSRLFHINLNNNDLRTVRAGIFDNANIPMSMVGNDSWFDPAEKAPDRTPYVQLDSNEISLIEDGALEGLPKVSLHHNPLEHLSSAWFGTSRAMQFIGIENASLETKDEDLFDVLAPNATVEMGNNPCTTFAEDEAAGKCSDLDNELECESLVRLARSTQYEAWDASDGWLDGSTYCDWYGVRCDSRLQHVVELHLDSNGLNGTLTEKSLSGLYWLKVLDLQNNVGLHGPVPSLAALAALEVLDLGGNNHTGEIPTILNPELRELYLDSNNFTGLLPDFYVSPHLAVLQVFDNKLDGTLPAFNELTALEHLMLHENRLFGEIPKDFSHLTALKIVSLHTNELDGVVPDISRLTKLKYFHAHGNRFTGIAKGLCDFKFQVEGDCQLQENPFVCEEIKGVSECLNSCRGECTMRPKQQTGRCEEGDGNCSAEPELERGTGEQDHEDDIDPNV